MTSIKAPASRRCIPFVPLSICALLAGCATVPLTEGAALSSAANLTPSDGTLTRTRQRIDKDALLAARTVRIVPAQPSEAATQAGLPPEKLSLVANAMNRALCSGLSRRYEVVAADAPADLVVSSTITYVGQTNTAAAGASSVLSLGSTVANAVTGLPVPSVRLPLGLGGLSVEAEAKNAGGVQVAAITWARGADMLTTKARVSEDGDAYALAKEFGGDFSKLLVTGTDPLKPALPDLPTAQAVGEFFGGKPKFDACEQFGRNPGLADVAGSAIGLPPSWTDKGGTNGVQ